MIFNLLRTYKVDVLRYLPRYLSKDETFKGTQDSLSEEHEKQRLLIIDICKQLFVETATWGLDDWERVYGLENNRNLSIDDRRDYLLIKIQGSQTITESKLQELINLVYPPGSAIVKENTGPNRFSVLLDTADALDEIRNVIEVYKPAHLTYAIAHEFNAKGPIVAVGAVTNTERIYIKQEKSDRSITARGIYACPVGAVAIRSNINLHY